MAFARNTKKNGGAGLFLLCILALGTAFWIGTHQSSIPSFEVNIPGLPTITLGARTCGFPLSYKESAFDARFDISETTFRKSIATAIDRWTKATGKKLFAEDNNNPIRIGLVYDERQQETEMLAKLGLSIEQSRTSFENIKKTYDSLKVEYTEKSAAYETSVKTFEAAQRKHNDAIAYWNERGGAPKKEYVVLKAEEESLARQADILEKNRLSLNSETETLNRMAGVLNQLADSLNLNVEKYNTSGQDIRKEFTAGVYQQDSSGKRINIYAFEDKEKLVDILTHEFGHALGLEHNDNPLSVMYRLNEGQSQKITASDAAALEKKCPGLK